MNEALQRRLSGIQDSRSTRGIMSRGKNVYNGGTSAANNQQNQMKKQAPNNLKRTKSDAIREAAERRSRAILNWRQ